MFSEQLNLININLLWEGWRMVKGKEIRGSNSGKQGIVPKTADEAIGSEKMIEAENTLCEGL